MGLQRRSPRDRAGVVHLGFKDLRRGVAGGDRRRTPPSLPAHAQRHRETCPNSRCPRPSGLLSGFAPRPHPRTAPRPVLGRREKFSDENS